MTNRNTLADLDISIGIADFKKVDAALASLKLKVEGSGTAFDRFSRTASGSMLRALKSTNSFLQSLQSVEASTKRVNGLWSSLKFGAGAGVGLAAVNKLRIGLSKIPDLIGQSIVDSSALKSVERRLQRTFGDLTADARQFAKDFSKEVGTAESQTKGMLAKFGATLEQTGLNPAKRAGAAKTLTRLSSDLAKAWGTDEADAADAMLSALRGESDPIERYGLLVKEATVNSKLFAMGIRGGSKAASESEKVMARFNVIVEQTKSIHGEGAKAVDGYTRETQKMGAAWQSFSETIGSAFEPAAAHVAKFLGETLTKLQGSLGPVDKLGERILVAAKDWTKSLNSMRESVLSFAGSPLESMTAGLKGLRAELGMVGDAMAGVYSRLQDLDSLNSGTMEWIRGRMRGDDVQSMISGSANTNAMNSQLKDLSSTRTTTQQEREEALAKARIPIIKRLAFAIEDALSGILGVTHGKHQAMPDRAVTLPGTDSAATASSPLVAAKPDAGTPPAPSAANGYGQIQPDRKPSSGGNAWATWAQKALEATTGIKTGRPGPKSPADEVFGGIKSPFTSMGEAVGNFAGAVTPHTDTQSRIKALEAEMRRPQVQFMGLEDIQKNFQMGLNGGVDKEKQLQLELLRKQLDSTQQAGKRLERLATDIAQAIRPLLGFQ